MKALPSIPREGTKLRAIVDAVAGGTPTRLPDIYKNTNARRDAVRKLRDLYGLDIRCVQFNPGRGKKNQALYRFMKERP